MAVQLKQIRSDLSPSLLKTVHSKALEVKKKTETSIASIVLGCFTGALSMCPFMTPTRPGLHRRHQDPVFLLTSRALE